MSNAPSQLPEAPATASTHAHGEFTCPNCGKKSDGEFCAACGQKKIHPDDLSLRHAWHHVVHEIVHVDGKFLNSLKLLFTRPGQLTLDFIEGRRARHVHPIQLFLLIGVAFFFLAHMNSPVDLRAAVEMQSPVMREKLTHMVAKRGLTLDQFLDQANARMDAVFKSVDTTAILLNGFWLWLMFKKRRPFLAENMVTTLHLACFTMALWLTIGSLHLVGVSRMFTTPLIFVAVFVYFLLTTRRVYGGSWLGLTVRWAILQIFRMVVILIAFVVVIGSVLEHAAPTPAKVAGAEVVRPF